LAPPLPYWLAFGFNTKALLSSPIWIQSVLGLSFYGVLALLFCTVRRRNGFAALHDLMTETRVVSLMALQSRPALALPTPAPPLIESAPLLGPYHLLETLEESAEHRWLLGYDLRLLRKVWLRTVPPGAAPIPTALRNLGRPGRLRWLTGRRSDNENWDAFEALSGEPLLRLIQNPQPWAQVRFWLYDLASEIRLAEKDGTLPPLGADRVWITGEGQAKLLDFPAPGLDFSIQSAALVSEQPGSQPPRLLEQRSPQGFLAALAKATLEGQPAAVPESGTSVAVPLPLHAQTFLKSLPGLLNMEVALGLLKTLLNRTATISRWRRAAVVFGCIAFPMLGSLSSYFGASAMEKWQRENPGALELSQIVQQRSTFNSKWMRKQPHPTDRQFSIYIAHHYRDVITNETFWSSPMVLAMIRGESRRFVEHSVADYPSPSAEEISEAEDALKPFRPSPELFNIQRAPWMVDFIPAMMLVAYVCLPALLAALAFRGGLVLLIGGIVFVKRNGCRASRLRVFWRGLLAWSPLAFGFALFMALRVTWSIGLASAAAAAWSLVGILTLASVWLPERGLPDRLAGTWPVPR